tara:strand:+ start:15627 stop:17354 length:1728 start_codon:yes stop_codon:yes gene_type:complete
MAGVFFDMGIIIIAATLLGIFFRFIKQPLIPAYVLAGILLGPKVLGLVTDFEVIKVLGEIGIAFLLFVVGLELDIKKLKDIGWIASIGGTIKTLLLFTLGYLIAIYSGVFVHIEAVYVGLIVAFSSTMIVIKLLADKREIDTLHGRIVIGILLLEDFLAILAMSFLGSIEQVSPAFLFLALLKGFFIFILILFSSKFIFPLLFKFAAKSQELLFLLSVTTLFIFSIGINYLGFSIAIGAFAAGVAIGNLPYNFQIIGKIKPLRDYFATLFFATLGMELVFTSVESIAGPLIVLLIIVIVLKPIVVMVIASAFGYTRKTSFLAGINLAQVSEFSLIIVAQGMLIGQISREIFSIAVILAVITIVITSYFVKFDRSFYRRVRPLLKPLNVIRGKRKRLSYMPDHRKYNAILLGYDRIGYSILQAFKKLGKKFVVVDFNPDIVKRLIREKIPCLYGDIGDPEILERLDLDRAEIVISTVPELQDNKNLIKYVKERNKRTSIFVTANRIHEALDLYEAHADYVILPHFLGGHHVSLMLEDVTGNLSSLLKNKITHIEELKKRKQIGLEHPKIRRDKEET